MTFEALAKERYSCRTFTGDKVDPKLTEQILDICLTAPTAHNNWPLEIFVIESDEAIQGVKASTRSHFDATLFILVCYDREKVWVRRFDQAHSGIDDAAIAGCHIMFAAESLGLGTTWVKAFDPAVLAEKLALPEHIVPVCLFPLGYKAADAKPSPSHAVRPAKEDVVKRI